MTFTLNGQEYEYFKHPYNRTALNMRAVEIPVVRRFLENFQGLTILEIGNVLSHYQPVSWPVVDIREKGDFIINMDVMKFQPTTRFDAIISISTLEHIGHGKYAGMTKLTQPSDVISRIIDWLSPKCPAIFTIPLNYNKAIDKQLQNNELPISEAYYMRRVSDKNEWEECTLQEALAAQRPAGYRWSVGLGILYCENA